MDRKLVYKRLSAALLLTAVWFSPLALIAQQTRIVMPKNKYKVQDDIKLGNDAARQVEQQFPIIRDPDAAAYVERVGQRLVDAIPREFSQPAFNYRFKWVNASDINAFALPGGPMFVDRGMIEAARNEGEMAGVMAHEISHVALRHATAQATKQSSAKNTLGTIGLILGGADTGRPGRCSIGCGRGRRLDDKIQPRIRITGRHSRCPDNGGCRLRSTRSGQCLSNDSTAVRPRRNPAMA